MTGDATCEGSDKSTSKPVLTLGVIDTTQRHTEYGVVLVWDNSHSHENNTDTNTDMHQK